jgi:hypothetical protein
MCWLSAGVEAAQVQVLLGWSLVEAAGLVVLLPSAMRFSRQELIQSVWEAGGPEGLSVAALASMDLPPILGPLLSLPVAVALDFPVALAVALVAQARLLRVVLVRPASALMAAATRD